jgi:glutamine synthetase adenylyltransferase
VDTRLRPYGAEGELATTPEELERYLAHDARPWEALTYTKQSFVAGDSLISARVLTSVWHQIIKLAARPGFSTAVRQMRERLERTNRYPHSFKQARGGFYDIDFLTSYLMLREASLTDGNTLNRLRHVNSIGAPQETEFVELERATLLYRTVDHVIRLVTGKPRPELPDAEHSRAAVEELVAKTFGRARTDLQSELNETAERVRRIFEQTVKNS